MIGVMGMRRAAARADGRIGPILRPARPAGKRNAGATRPERVDALE